MPRNRHKSIYTKAPSPDFQKPSIKHSHAAQIMANRIASGGVDYLKQNLGRIMMDSAKLAEEPEFINLYPDSEKVIGVNNAWLKRYEKQLVAAQKKGSHEFDEVLDKMRIEAVEELATPAFRKDVDKRLQAMRDRLMVSEDLEKLEIVLLLTPLLGIKKVPWGLCGLILIIFNRTLQQGIQKLEDQEIIYDAVVAAFKDEGEADVDLSSILKSTEKLEEIGTKLIAKTPGLRERIAKQVFDMVVTFEQELLAGKITLDLFTEAELFLLIQRLEAKFGGMLTQVKPSEVITKQFFDEFVQAINEIMTPERFQRLRKDVQSTAETWLRERSKWAAALQAELLLLEGEQFKENKFVFSVFMGQLSRLGKEQKSAQK